SGGNFIPASGTYNGTITFDNINAGGAAVQVITGGTGSLLNGVLTTQITGSSVTLGAGANIGAATSGNVISTLTRRLAANAGGNVYVTNLGSVQLLGSSAGSSSTFSLVVTPDAVTGNGQITVAGAVTGGTITLQSDEIPTGTQGIGGIVRSTGGSLSGT